MGTMQMAPRVLAHPGARTTRRLRALVIETSLARSAQESVECFRHEGEECPRCDGSGYRPRKYCAGCGEPAGSISQRTGAPLVEDRRTERRFYHVRCLPGNSFLDAHWSCLERMGG
jgi:hypothetical protein